jgi:hypothetical protein
MKTTCRGALTSVTRQTLAAWMASFAIVMAACNVMAPAYAAQSEAEHEPVSLTLAEVERLFWLCDYVATTRGVDLAPVDLCSAATEELKNAKFGGDFLALLTWWRSNKLEAHGSIAKAAEAAGAPGPHGDEARAHAAAL